MNISRRLRLYFWVFLALNLGYIIWSRSYLKPLQTNDIVQFEVAKTLPVAERIIGEWSQSGKLEKARQSIWIDYIFILLYSGGLISGVLLLSRSSQHELLRRMGKFIAMLIPIAAICDIAENISMARSLSGRITAFSVRLSYDMAVAKFSIIILALIFIFICLLFWIGSRVRPRA